MKKNTAFLIETEDQLARFFEDFKPDFWNQNFQTVAFLFKKNKYAADNFGTIILLTKEQVIEKKLEIVENPYIEKSSVDQDEIYEIVLDNETVIEELSFFKKHNKKFKDLKNLFKIAKLPIPDDNIIYAIIDAWEMTESTTENILEYVLKHEK